MAATHEDRNAQLSPGVAIKAPCRAASIGALTLSGEQTVDAVALITGDRVLVKDQVDQTTNGIYLVSTGTWTREPDFDGNRDVVKGTFVFITNGATNAGAFYECTAANPVVFGTSLITFAQGALGPIAIPISATNVTFTPAGAGAVARPVQSKLVEVFSSADRSTVGARNTGLGEARLTALSSGVDDTAIGYQAENAVTTGSANTAVGARALLHATTQANNTAIGADALNNNGTGVASGNNNTAVGVNALLTNTLGDNNVAVGVGALQTANLDENVAVGVNALQNISGAAKRNTAVGSYALQAAGTFLSATAVGYNAGNANTANSTTAVGSSALVLNTSGTSNTAVGAGALQGNITGASNTAVGLNAAATSNASDITAVGLNALVSATGATNTAIGSSAGSSLTTGSNNTIIGANAQASAVGAANEITLGNSTQTIVRTAAGIRPGTETGNFQTAATVYAGTGVPNNANGQNGDYYYRSDGTAAPTATKDHCYFKAAGVWGGVF